MNSYMKEAINEANYGINKGHGGPFGAVIVKDGKIISKAHNEVLLQQDATCHGEMLAIRKASESLHTHDLNGCDIYTTAEPCPMCLGALMWANIRKIYYGCTVIDTENIGFRDSKFYKDLDNQSLIQCEHEECKKLFDAYSNIENKKLY